MPKKICPRHIENINKGSTRKSSPAIKVMIGRDKKVKPAVIGIAKNK